MDSNVKTIVIALGSFIIAGSAVVAANSVYTHTTVGIDYKPLIAATIVGLGVAYLVSTQIK